VRLGKFSNNQWIFRRIPVKQKLIKQQRDHTLSTIKSQSHRIRKIQKDREIFPLHKFLWSRNGHYMEILNHSSQHFYYFVEHEKIKILWAIIKRIWPSQTDYGFYSEREKSFHADVFIESYFGIYRWMAM
jgi:hypothetical protein